MSRREEPTMLMTSDDLLARGKQAARFAPHSSPANRSQRREQRGCLVRPRRWVPKPALGGSATIERRVERAVRRTLGGAVAGEIDRFNSELSTIVGTGQEFSTQAVNLATSIGSVALFSIHHGNRPDRRLLGRLTREFSVYESWTGFDPDTARTYLGALADRRPPVRVLSVEDTRRAAFLVGGWLISAFLPDDVQWTDFLDGILVRLEDGSEGNRPIATRIGGR
jgi:hypothetical protein